MRIYLLDMGRPIYGDCILITHNSRRILIDGAHPGDRASILSQLKGILHQERPFSIDLLIVTHCHQDHIGCLPTLVGPGDLSIKSLEDKVEFSLFKYSLYSVQNDTIPPIKYTQLIHVQI